MRIQFHLDESVSEHVVHAMRQRGFDVSVPHDVGLKGASDIDHLSYCLSEGRVIVTHDTDFLILNAQGAIHSGIVFGAQNRFSVSDIVSSLCKVAETHDSDSVRGIVFYVKAR